MGDENLSQQNIEDMMPAISNVATFSKNMLMKEREKVEQKLMESKVNKFLDSVMTRVVCHHETGSEINVVFGKSTMEIRFSSNTDEFGKIAEQVADAYGIDREAIFLSDKQGKGAVYLKN